MEAIAAAGALPGLASATIQLSTATFQFYRQLCSLYKAIKDGKNDPNTAYKRLDQHHDFIKELRFNFERIPDHGVSASTRHLFECCIADSEAEVEEFRNLLGRVSKSHFKRKAWQAVETGTRLRVHERSIQKYCDLLDKQMQRLIFLQSSAQSMHVESKLSDVMHTLVEQGTKAAASRNKQVSARHTDRQPHSPSKLNETRASSVGKPGLTTLSDIIPQNWHQVELKTYSTLCGTVTVTIFSVSALPNDEDYQLAYRVWFKPYSWISRKLVEWRCLVGSTQTPSTSLSLSVTTSIVCDDPDVLDALGLSEYTYDLSKLPSPKKVRALLDTRRLLKEHVFVVLFDCVQDIVTTFFTSWNTWYSPNYYYCCCPPQLNDPLKGYLEVRSVVQILFSYGFKPSLSNWSSIYYQAVRYHCHILQVHPGLVNTITIPSLVLEACGYFIPAPSAITIEDDDWVQVETANGSASTTISADIDDSNVSYFGVSIAQHNSGEKMRDDILELDPLDLADEKFDFDRWLLSLFAPFRPEVASLIESYLTSYNNVEARERFEIQYIREEFKQPPRTSSRAKRQALLLFVCIYGSVEILQQLDIAALTPEEITQLQLYAAQVSDRTLFDIVIKQGPCELRIMPHTSFMRGKLTADSAFLEDFITLLEPCGELDPLSKTLKSFLTLHLLFIANPHPFPDYMWKLIVGQVRSREARPIVIGYVIHSLLFEAMDHHRAHSKSAECLLQDLHLYRVLNILACSSAFKLSLDRSRKTTKRLQYMENVPYPSVDGYSALMLALHCGMKPAVQILADAGAVILEPADCGKSPLSVASHNARSHHPRSWARPAVAERGAAHQAFFSHSKESERRAALRVPESTDKEMLEILLKALRDRGEVYEEEVDEIREASKWSMFPLKHYEVRARDYPTQTSLVGIFTAKAYCFSRWLFQPGYAVDPDTLRENIIYTSLVSTLWFLSVLKILKDELGDYLLRIANLLSRPIVIPIVVVLILFFLR
ncbi:hypothetical protein F4802DRAFT_599654 [Xylaria palmicola]|nr:hypothetical protein F4802DRAFT_599654 [Xylaria palmicola]